MQGKDVVGESATGSGKTLAFGCGIIERAVPRQGVQAVVLTPTRELAEQVKQSLSKLSQLRVAAVYGGRPMRPQVRDIAHAEIVVATPGRLLDHIERQSIDLSHVSMAVLDEADRMLDMGFVDDVKKILSACPSERQTLFFSATISGRIEKLIRKFMKDPVRVSVKNQVDPSKLEQVYYPVKGSEKLSLLVQLLSEPYKLAMVFCNTRKTTDMVAKTLKANGVEAMAIHGGFEQNKRARTISAFNRRQVTVLVCTDVAARGIHIDEVSHVYNYEIPKDPSDYVHRIGRTARGGESGRVVNFTLENARDFANVRRAYRMFTIRKMAVPETPRINVARKEVPQARGSPRNSSRGSRGGPRGSRREDRGFQKGKGKAKPGKKGGKAHGKKSNFRSKKKW